MKKRATSRGWLGLIRFWDKLCVWAERAWRRSLLSSVVGEGPGWVKRLRRYPAFESLETRQLLSASLGFANEVTTTMTYGVGGAGEAASTITVWVNLTRNTPTGAITVDYSTADLGVSESRPSLPAEPDPSTYRRAVAGEDYGATSGTLTFPAGSTNDSQSFTVTVTNDIIDEFTEVFKAALSNVTGGASLSSSVAYLTILDDADPAPTIKFSVPWYNRTESGSVATITFSLDHKSERSDILAKYAARGCGCGASAPEEGVSFFNPAEEGLPPNGKSNPLADQSVDFTPVKGLVTIPLGSTSGSFTVPIQDDALQEGPEDVGLYLTGWTYATLASPAGARATLTIDDNDITTTSNSAGVTYTFSGGVTKRKTFVTSGAATGEVATTIDERGKTTTYTHDSGTGLLTGVVDPTGRTITYSVGANGLVASRTLGDPDGAGPLTASTTTYDYDVNDRLTLVTNPDSSYRQYSYDSRGNLLSQIDETGNAVSYTYGSDNLVNDMQQLLTRADAFGTTTYDYDPATHQLRSVEDPLGRVTTYTFNGNGWLTRLEQPDPDGAGPATSPVTSYVYDSVGRVTVLADPLNRVTTTTYDSRGRVSVVTGPDPGALNSLVTTYGYDASDAWSTVTSPDLTVTTSLYDARGRLTASIDAGGATTVYAYDQASRMTSTTAPGSSATLTKYDDAGRVTETVDVSGRSATTIFDARGRVSATVDVYGNRTTFGYDALDRRVTVEDADHHLATTGYDVAGRVTSSIDIFGNTTLFSYDAAGRQTRVEDADGNVTTSVYDAAGQLVERHDWYGAITTYTFDDLGRQVRVEDADHNITTTLFDAAGQVTETIDPFNQRTTSQYDGAGRQTVVIDIHSKRTTTSYDQKGRVTSVVDIYQHPTTYSFDAQGRVTTVQDVYGNTSTTTFDTHNRVQTTTDGHNRTTTYGYDAQGRVTSVSDALGTSTTVYDATYNRVSMTIDRLGGIATTLYDARGRVTGAIDEAGRRTTSVYDAHNRVTETADSHNYRTTIQFDDRGRYTATVDARGNVSSIAYDDRGRQTTAYNALHQATTSVYDDRGRVTETVTPYGATGATTTVVFDDRGRVTASLDALGQRTTSIYDNRSRVSETIDALGYHSTVVYDSFGRVSATVDPLNHTTTIQYDNYGRAIRTEDPLGHGTTAVYDTFDRVTASIAPFGTGGTATTLYAYDDFDRRVSVTDPSGNVTTSAYDALGRETQTTAPVGGAATFAYDRVGRLTSSTDREGQRRDFQYDVGATTMTYSTVESWYRASATVAYDVLTFTFDTVGNELVAKNTSAGAQTMVYDALNRVTSVAQTSGVTLTFSYDVAGNRTVAADSKGSTETSIYDANHQLRRRLRDATNWVDFRYDANGREIAQTRHHLASGSADALTEAPKILGITVNGGPVQALDAYGNTPYLFGQQSIVAQLLVTFDRPVVFLDENNDPVNPFSIDNLYASVTESVPGADLNSADVDVNTPIAVDGSGGRQFVLTFSGSGTTTYDNSMYDGNIFTVLKNGLYRLHTDGDKVHAGGETMEDDREDVFWTLYGSYDSSDILVSATPGTSIVAVNSSIVLFGQTYGSNPVDVGPWPFYLPGFDANLDGEISADSVDFGNNFGTEWEWSNTVYAASSLVAFTATRYDAAGRLVQQLSSDRIAGALTDYQNTYDAAGRVTVRRDGLDITTFTYDDGGQVKTETKRNYTEEEFETTTYTYDTGGNRTTVAGPSGTVTYDVDPGNQYDDDGLWDYTYDDEGNLTAKESLSTSAEWAYFYDNRNQLIKAERKTNGVNIDLRVEYKYDASGNRVKKIADLDGDGVGNASLLRYTIDGWNPNKRASVGLENVDVWSDNEDNGALKVLYTHGDGVDQVLGRVDSGGHFWYLNDHQGSVRAVVDVDGVVHDRITYDAYGNILTETNATYRGRYAWTGREIETELGLQYNRARYYSPDLGRWISKDPLGFDAGDSNLYRYVNNAPTNYVDPSGNLVYSTENQFDQFDLNDGGAILVDIKAKKNNLGVNAIFSASSPKAEILVFAQAVKVQYGDRSSEASLAGFRDRPESFYKWFKSADGYTLDTSLDGDPYYNAQWDGSKWIGTANLDGTQNKLGGNKVAATLSDGPQFPESRLRCGKGDLTVSFQTEIIDLKQSSRSVLGVVTWGFRIKDAMGSPVELQVPEFSKQETAIMTGVWDKLKQLQGPDFVYKDDDGKSWGIKNSGSTLSHYYSDGSGYKK